jgi:hypothetical protein
MSMIDMADTSLNPICSSAPDKINLLPITIGITNK